MVGLNEYLMLAAILFVVGLTGVIVRRNIIVIFMCLEMMLSAAGLTLAAFSRFNTKAGLPDIDPQVMVLFVITVAAAEVAVGLALIVALFKARQTVDTQHICSMKN